MTELALRRAPVGWKQDDYDVVAGGILVGRIFLAPAAPEDRQWMWAIGHDHREKRSPTHGYAPTREAAMEAFKRSWHRET